MILGLAGRAVLVTGAASGIGAATARAFAVEGATVALVDRDPAGQLVADRLAGETGSRCVFLRADVTDEGQVAIAVADAVAALGGLDVAVGCAGVSGPFGRGPSDITVAEWDQVMAVNVRGQFLLAKHCASALTASPAASIVMIASDSGFVAAPGMAPYCASKGAVVMLVKALSVDLASSGIRVNCVCPSIVDTPMARRDLGAADGFGGAPFPVHTPDQVARTVLFLASSAAESINGTAIVSDFGAMAQSTFPA